jgi:hypothetical protein
MESMEARIKVYSTTISLSPANGFLFVKQKIQQTEDCKTQLKANRKFS